MLYEVKWKEFCSVIDQYPEMFPGKLRDKKLFMYLYCFVCTRSYGNIGYLETSAALIPMADNVNHNSVEYLNSVVITDLIEKGQHQPGAYLVDYTSLFKSRGWSDSKINKSKFIKGKWDRERYEEN